MPSQILLSASKSAPPCPWLAYLSSVLDVSAARYPWGCSTGLVALEGRAVLLHWGGHWSGHPVQENPAGTQSRPTHCKPAATSLSSDLSPARVTRGAPFSSHPIPEAEKAKPTLSSFIPSLALAVRAAEAGLGSVSSGQLVAPAQSCSTLPKPAPSSQCEEARLENSPRGAGKKARRSAC